MRRAPPFPPLEMRALVGPTDDSAFDNPTGAQLFPDVDASRVLDFGCGCGRLARQLIQQAEQPERYLGLDLHAGMIEWCRANLAPLAPQFDFRHHDVFNVGFNPHATERFRPLPADSRSFSIVLGHSVFTHILQEEVGPYLHEISRVLEVGGIFRGTWFTFDPGQFPMLQSFQHALYINHVDPTNAVIFDRSWIREIAAEAGLRITAITSPAVRGYHWYLDMQHDETGVTAADWPPDGDVLGALPPPLSPPDAARIGLD